MTKIDGKYMYTKPQTIMNITEGLRVSRHDRLLIRVFNTFLARVGVRVTIVLHESVNQT